MELRTEYMFMSTVQSKKISIKYLTDLYKAKSLIVYNRVYCTKLKSDLIRIRGSRLSCIGSFPVDWPYRKSFVFVDKHIYRKASDQYAIRRGFFVLIGHGFYTRDKLTKYSLRFFLEIFC